VRLRLEPLWSLHNLLPQGMCMDDRRQIDGPHLIIRSVPDLWQEFRPSLGPLPLLPDAYATQHLGELFRRALLYHLRVIELRRNWVLWRERIHIILPQKFHGLPRAGGPIEPSGEPRISRHARRKHERSRPPHVPPRRPRRTKVQLFVLLCFWQLSGLSPEKPLAPT
jgi:hypothetical protein